MADLKWFTPKGKSVTYTEVFVKIDNWKNHRQFDEINSIIELEKMRTLTAKNPRNLNAHQIIKISSILRSAHLVLRNQDKFMFYINKYINWNQLNKFYYLDQMRKGIRNADAITHKLGLAITRATNQRIESAREER